MPIQHHRTHFFRSYFSSLHNYEVVVLGLVVGVTAKSGGVLLLHQSKPMGFGVIFEVEKPNSTHTVRNVENVAFDVDVYDGDGRAALCNAPREREQQMKRISDFIPI